MESVLSFVAKWVSVKEMKALQGARIHVWKELSDDRQRYLLEKEESPAL